MGLLFLIPLAVWSAAQSAGFIANQLRVMREAPEAQEFASALSVTIAQIGIGTGALLGGRAVDWNVLASLGWTNAAAGAAGLVIASFIALGTGRRHTGTVPAE